MKLATDEQDVLNRTRRWTERHEAVRAVVLTSSRAVAQAASAGPVDLLSDYDIVLIVTELAAFVRTEAWMAQFGTPLLTVRDSEREFGVEVRNRMVLYDDGTKIDYSIWPASLPERIERARRLPETFDVGYRVLLDKDGHLATLPPPTFTAYISGAPAEWECQALIQEFWFCATYIAKYLWREELMPAKVILDYEMTCLLARRMLEWRIELDHDWSVRPGFFERGLRRYFDPATWAELEATYSGAIPEEMWSALDRAIRLSRRVAISVGDDLSFTYPNEVDETMADYLGQGKQLPQLHQDFEGPG